MKAAWFALALAGACASGSTAEDEDPEEATSFASFVMDLVERQTADDTPPIDDASFMDLLDLDMDADADTGAFSALFL